MAVPPGAHAVAAAAEIVIPTVGRPSLAALLRALGEHDPPWPGRVIVVDDRADTDAPLPGLPGTGADVVRSGARGPAAARNAGLAAGQAPWIVFLDDDVVPAPGWVAALHADLAVADDSTAGSQGRVLEPSRASISADDAERRAGRSPVVAADLALRRDALVVVGGFDERFPHPHREGADLALRLRRAGATIEPGTRAVIHPPRPAGLRAGVRRERGNRDDARMRWEHGRNWRRDAAVEPGRLGRHLVDTAMLTATGLAAVSGHRRIATATGALWLASTADLARARGRSGRRAPAAVTRDAIATPAIPPVAVYQRIRGELAVRKPDPR